MSVIMADTGQGVDHRRMRNSPIYWALVLATATGAVHPQHHDAGAHQHSAGQQRQQTSPYADEAPREIKALSADEQQAWLEGRGSGLARAAELNRHPGPMHVLELGQQLALSAGQQSSSRELMHRHKAEVRELGQRLVSLERTLDRLFAAGTPVDAAKASSLVEAIALLAGRIRASHLRTHIEQTALLTPEQVKLYDRLRGYRK